MTTVAVLTTIKCGAPAGDGYASAMQSFRLRKSFAAVHFDPAGKGCIAFLPEGAELRIAGSSSLSECFEVVWESRLYNIFKVDLLGAWSNQIDPSRAMAAKATA